MILTPQIKTGSLLSSDNVWGRGQHDLLKSRPQMHVPLQHSAKFKCKVCQQLLHNKGLLRKEGF